MEQQLINNLLKLITLAGGSALVHDLVKEGDEEGNPKSWNNMEVEKAVEYIRRQVNNFSTSDAIIIVENLVREYNLPVEAFQKNKPNTGADSETPAKVAGLQ